MKNIYFLLLMSFFCQSLSAQNNTTNNSYPLAFTRDGGQNCRGGLDACGAELQSAFRNNQTYEAIGNLWFDKFERVMLELQKNSLSQSIQDDISQDGLFSLPYGWRLSDFILIDKRLKGVAETISPGNYIVIEKEHTVLIVLGKLN